MTDHTKETDAVAAIRSSVNEIRGVLPSITVYYSAQIAQHLDEISKLIGMRSGELNSIAYTAKSKNRVFGNMGD